MTNEMFQVHVLNQNQVMNQVLVKIYLFHINPQRRNIFFSHFIFHMKFICSSTSSAIHRKTTNDTSEIRTEPYVINDH